MALLAHQKSLLARIAGTALAVIGLAAALAVGLAVFFVFIGVAAVALAVFYLRLQWARRRGGSQPRSAARPGQVIEGEFTVERSSPEARQRQ